MRKVSTVEVVLFLILLAVIYACRMSRSAGTIPASKSIEVRTEYLVDSIAMQSWVDSIVALKGDSLARAFSSRAATVRIKWANKLRIDTVRDTIPRYIQVTEDDARAFMAGDTACSVTVDSLRASEAACVEYTNELLKRPESCSSWSAFGIGFGAGAASASAVCVLTR